MIEKQHRFHGLNALNPVYKKGRGIRQGALTLIVSPSRRKDYRLAVVVSKKVHKSAVTRNRIRRRLYESVRVIKKRDSRPWPFDMILTCFDEKIAEQPAGELHSEVEKLLKKAKITA